MSKEIKQNCQRMIDKMENRLEELLIGIKIKKSHCILQKIVLQTIQDFKFFRDEFKVISHHMAFLQTKSHQKDMLISRIEQELLSKNAEKKMFEQMMKTKYEKIAKQQKFLQFVGKDGCKPSSSHERYKSQIIMKGLSQLQKDIVDSNKRVCRKVKQLQSQIQNQQQGHQNFQNKVMSQNITSDFNISNIAPENNPFISPSKSMTKKDKIKALYLDTDDNITAYKTKKKELPSHNQQESIQSLKQKEPTSSQTVVINRKKKQELADLIAQQTKIIVARQKYFSTDI